jgi:hypothetical protein
MLDTHTNGKEETTMIKLAVCYMRYALVALATVGFDRGFGGN